MIVIDSLDPATLGVGSPLTCVAEDQLPSVISASEYLMSYVVAVPVLSSSPDAVHESLTVDWEISEALKLVTASGVELSSENKVLDDTTLDNPDSFGTSSEALRAM